MLRNEPSNSPAILSGIKKVFSGGANAAKIEQYSGGGKVLPLHSGSSAALWSGVGVRKGERAGGLVAIINIVFFILNLLIFTVLVVSARSHSGGNPHQPASIKGERTVGGGGGVLGAEEGQHASPSSGAQLANCLALVRSLQQARHNNVHHLLPSSKDNPAANNLDDKNLIKNKEGEGGVREEGGQEHVDSESDRRGESNGEKGEVSSTKQQWRYGSLLIPPPTNNVLAVAAARNEKEQQQQSHLSPFEDEGMEKESGNGNSEGRSPRGLANSLFSPKAQLHEHHTMLKKGVEQQKQLPYLIIGMPSAPRPKELRRGEGVNHNVHDTILYRTLQSISAEMENSELLRRLVKVVVMNARPASRRPSGTGEFDPSHPHRTFEEVKDAFVGTPGSSAVYVSTELLPRTSGNTNKINNNTNITDDDFFPFSRSSMAEMGAGISSSSSRKNAAEQPWLYFIDKPSPLQDEKRLGFSFLSSRRPYLSNPLRDADSTADDQEFGHKQQEMPTESVRRQTNDVIALLDLIKGKSSYFYFSEDDMSFCGNTVTTILYMIEKARRTLTASCTPRTETRGERLTEHRAGVRRNRDGDDGVLLPLREEEGGGPFAAIRCGFGLNGIIMHNGGPNPTTRFFTPNANEAIMTNSSNVLTSTSRYPDDVAAFADYLYRYQFRRPPDHLATEFFAQESRLARAHYEKPTYVDFCTAADEPPESAKHYNYQQKKNAAKRKSNKRSRRVAAFRYNVVQHLGGSTSTLRDEEAWAMPECFAELTEPQVFAVEAWNANECGHTDLWPCSSPRGEGGEHNGGFGKIQMRVP